MRSKTDELIREFQLIIRAKSTPELSRLHLQRAINVLKEIKPEIIVTPIKKTDVNKQARKLIKQKVKDLELKYKSEVENKKLELEQRYEKKFVDLRKILAAKRQMIKDLKRRLDVVGALDLRKFNGFKKTG